MIRTLRTLGLSLLVAIPVLAAAPVEWDYSQRDVYIDGAIDRGALVYRTMEPTRTVVLSESLGEAVILDEASSTRSSAGLRAFVASPDRTRVRTSNPRVRREGLFTRTSDGVLATRVGRHDVVVASHQSPAGPLAVSSFLHDYPVWDALREAWEPDADSVERLAAVSEATDITIVFATWCGDSQREVPRVLRAVELANNPMLRIHLVGVSSDFDEPLGLIEERHIINVPTMIVERGDQELGRVVETAASSSTEQDIADILDGSLSRHPGRWEREHEVASGRYEIRYDDGRSGGETWRIFSTANGGKLAHSVIDDGRINREVWHRFDEAGATTFVEITDRTGSELRRTRYWKRGTRLTAHSRGSDSGIIDQVLELPEDCGFCTGSIATEAMGLSSAAAYAVPLHDAVSSGVIRQSTISPVSYEVVDVAGGRRHARRVHASSGTTHRDVWIDADLGVPLRETGAGFIAELVELEGGEKV